MTISARPRPTAGADADHPTWAALLERAITEPGTLAACYGAFWRYSLGNQLLALMQCGMRGIEPGPIATFKRWQALGRQVRKGERALALCMPRPTTFTREDKATGEEQEVNYVRFIFANNWFVLAQTDPIEGAAPYEVEALPEWDRARALAALEITEVPFGTLDGNKQGWSIPADRTLALNPVAAHPFKTTFHECAHILLGHGSDDRQERAWGEVEAECVALLCCASLGLPGEAESRGYVQRWLERARVEDERRIGEEDARRIMGVADRILRAGRPTPAGKEEG